MALKDYFYFTKDERRGVTALLVVIAVLFGVRIFLMENGEWRRVDEHGVRIMESDGASTLNSQLSTLNSPKYKPYTKREVKDVMVELNSADTLQLQELRGIGPGFARRIVKYREKLGGYYAKEQLMEVYGFTDSLYRQVSPHVTVDASKIQKLNINELGIAELKRHPYISFFEAKAIVDYRNSKPSKHVDSIDELAILPDLKENWDVIRIYIKTKRGN